MSGSNPERRGQELESAREREFDSLLEQEFAGAPPVEAILKRAESAAGGASQKPVRSWMAAALILLGVGVAVAVAWNAQVERDDHDAAAPQDPTPVELQWPKDAVRVYRPEQLSELPVDTTHVSLGITLEAAGDLSRLASLQQLEVLMTPRGMGKMIKSGGGVAGSRLDTLKTAKGLRRLSIQTLPAGPADLEALRYAEQLQVLELSTLLELSDEFMAELDKGGMILGRAFDAEIGAAVARSSRAKSLRLSGMPMTAEGLRALAGAELHSLILSATKLKPEVLEVLGELKTLRHLELRYLQSASIAKGAGFSSRGMPVLTPAVMRRLGSLPVLQSLRLHHCHLDPAVVAALPRDLKRLDLSTCFGVDGSLVGVVATMPELQEIGLPMIMADGKDWGSLWRPPLLAPEMLKKSLTGDQAASIIGSRVWQGLLLEGQLTEAVASELANQSALRTLSLRPTSKSVSLAFVAKMPKLERFTFVETDVTEQMVQPLNSCTSLQTVAFHSCRNDMQLVKGRVGLRDGLAVEWGFEMVF